MMPPARLRSRFSHVLPVASGPLGNRRSIWICSIRSVCGTFILKRGSTLSKISLIPGATDLENHSLAMDNAKDTPEVENEDAQPEEVSAEAAEAAEAAEFVAEGAAEAAEEPAEEPKELTLEEQLEAAKAEASDNYNNYLRSVADLDTYRRRVMREKDELKQYAISGLLEDFLPVYDNLGLGLMSAEQTSDPKIVVQGIQMVMAQFKSLLEENGITEVAPGTGDDFDPNVAEAFQTQPSDEVEEGKVLTLMRKGFTLNGRLIRPANVVVSGGPATDSE